MGALNRKPYALITGASGGIGLELARVFAKNQYNLVLVARDEKKLQAAAQSLVQAYGVECKVVSMDLSLAQSPSQLFNRLVTDGIDLEVLVNNAGFGVYGRFHETSWEREREMIQLNVMTLTELTKLFLPGMVARKSGRILNVASTAAFQPGPLMAIYFATKAFVLYFSEAIAEELRGSGVSVTALCPGATETEFFKSANMSQLRLLQMTDSASDVAEEAYRALLREQRVVVTGWRNKLLSSSVRFVPRLLSNRLAMKMLERA